MKTISNYFGNVSLPVGSIIKCYKTATEYIVFKDDNGDAKLLSLDTGTIINSYNNYDEIGYEALMDSGFLSDDTIIRIGPK